MLKTSGDEIIADKDILTGFNVQDSCIKHHNVEFWITSTSVVKNSDQSEAQNSDARQLKLQLAGD